MPDSYTPLYSEILDKLSKIKSKKDKVIHLKKYNDPSLRMVIKSSFDPKIKWALPEGEVPYRKNEAPEGTEHTVLASETRKLWHFIKGADNETSQAQKEKMFIQMCEGLCHAEAKLLIAAKDKKLHQVYKGLSKDVVKEAFGWNEDYVIPDAVKYPQQPGLASGPN